MNWLASFESGKRLDRFSCLLFGEPQIVKALQIQPKLRTGTEEMGETQSGIAGDGASTVQDLRDAIGRHIHLARQFRRAQAKGFQFFSQVFTRMDSGDSHNSSPSDNRQSPRWTGQAIGRATQSTSAIDR